MTRRAGAITASVLLAVVIVVGLGIVLIGPATVLGEGASAPSRTVGEPTTEATGSPAGATPEPADAAPSSAGAPGATSSAERSWNEHLGLREPAPDAPVGPQPIPEAADVPVRVRIPAIGVDSSLEDLVRSGEGVLQPPVVPELAGWFTGGTVPGDIGPAVIAGHVDSGVAGAVFRDLDQLEPGAEILVEMSDGEVVTFRMDRADVVRQAQFPSVEVYGPVPDRQLRLITCHTFDPDNRAYVDNLVIFATAA